MAITTDCSHAVEQGNALRCDFFGSESETKSLIYTGESLVTHRRLRYRSTNTIKSKNARQDKQ
ncbi:MAG: hypothetical protein ACJZ8O_04670 [Pirellulaceae bacterium]